MDDDPDTLELERVVLQRAAATVSCASTVEAAMELHRSQPAAVIVSDLAMPGLDGFHLARALRQDEGGQRTPLLALSAHASNATRAQAMAAGFDAFLTKPVHPGELVEAVARLAAVKGRARPS